MMVCSNYSFSKKSRLLSRKQFLEVTKYGCEHSGNYLIVHIKFKKQSLTKLGITVTRRFGKAHDRNHFKRMIREAFRLSFPSLPSHLHIHVKPKTNGRRVGFQEVKKELFNLIEEFQNKKIQKS